MSFRTERGIGFYVDDPAVRLDVIAWLRANGWSVEPK